jgi:hypothetical protein
LLGQHIDFLREQMAAGRVSVEEFNGAMAALSTQQYVNLGDNILAFVDRYYSESLVGERLRADLVRVNQALEFANLRLQRDLLVGLGLLTQAQIDLIDGVLGQLETMQNMTFFEPPPDTTIRFDLDPEELKNGMKGAADAAEDFADAAVTAAQDLRDAFVSAADNFKNLWQQITGGSADPVTAAQQQIADLRDAFAAMDPFSQRTWLKEHGVDVGTGGILSMDWEQLFEDLLDQLDLVGKAFEDLLRPLHDFWDELRTSGATQTRTQQYDATYAAFVEAANTGNLERAIGFGRDLLQGIGLQQFGGSSQAYQDLYDFVVRTLGGFDPNGPPDDLLAKSVQVQTDSRALLQQNHDDNLQLIAAIRENTTEVKRLQTITRREGGGS